MISIIITAFREQNTIGKAIESIASQDIKEDYEIIVSCPDKETAGVVNFYAKKYKQVRHFKDPGKGKSFALNMLFGVAKGRILILTDGDVYVGENSINEILKLFENEKIGCVSGRPVSTNQKNTLLGYWSHLLADAGAHRIRKERFEKNEFLECSAYFFAFRKGIIKKIPLDVAEDAIIPYEFWKKGYKIGYEEDAKVYVKNPVTFHDWVKQRKRTADAHTKLTGYVPNFPKVKSFWNEIKKGTFWALSYPKSPKEFFWTLALFFARFYIWVSIFIDNTFRHKEYNDAWARVESTK